MKRTVLLFAFLLLACNFAAGISGAQTLSGTAPVKWVSALPATCTTTRRDRVMVYKYTATSGIYYCSAANTWTLIGSPTFSTVVLGPNGTAAAPTFSFSADPDTGVFRSGTNALGFATGGTETGTLSSAGLLTTTGGLASTTGAFSGVVTGTQGAITTSQPWLNHTATWNAGGVTFTDHLVNITNTASAAGSLFFDYQVGGVSQFKVTRAGVGTFTGAVAVADDAYAAGWNGSSDVPTKNAVYDKIETLGGSSYLIYRATCTQTSTNAPVCTVLENTTGTTITWAYSSAGVYTATAGTAIFTANKTFMMVGQSRSGNNGKLTVLTRSSTTDLLLYTHAGVAVPSTDGSLNETAVEILIYP